MTTSRDRILSKIETVRKAKALPLNAVDCPVGSGLKIPEGDLISAFKESLELINGHCYVSDNERECVEMVKSHLDENGVRDKTILSHSILSSPFSNLHNNDIDLSEIAAGITSCELLSAQTGTVLLTAKEERRLIALSPIHIVIARRSQLRATLDECVKELVQKYNDNLPSQLTLITGPSRTADIEKTLILGAHGPKKLAVFIVENS